MCPATALCRLCLCFSSEFKQLVDEAGQYNEIYYIVSSYFDAMLLTTEICVDCWQHIHAFYEYQQSVLKAQSNLNDVVKIESETALEMVQIDNDYDNNLKEEYADIKINLKDYNPFESDDDAILSPQHSNKKIRAFGEQKIKETKNNIKKLDESNDNSTEFANNSDNHDDDSTHEKYSFKCSICEKDYKHARGLRRHMAAHTVRDTYQCPYCPTEFQGKDSIPRHVRQFHPSEIPNFNIRELKSLNSSVLKNEVFNQESICEPLISLNATSEKGNLSRDRNDDTTEGKQKYKCTKCDKEYSKSVDLRYHMDSHKNEAINQCPYCPTKLSLPRNIRRHIKALHPEKYVEPDVPKVDLNLLGRHLINSGNALANVATEDTINDDLPNYNDYDAFIAKWKQELECTICKNTFKSFDLLRQHFRVEHPLDKCHVMCCEKKFLFRTSFVEHIRLHLDPNSFKCTICGRCSDSSLLLKLHMRSHSVEKRFQCNVCHKKFRKKSHLLHHSGIHSTEKNHVCKVCNKGFSTIYLLKKHNYVHDKFNSKHLCDQCGKRCYSAHDLKNHLLTHDSTGVSKSMWPCDICGAQLKTRLTLKRHKLTTHSDNKIAYECSECGKISPNEFALKSHKKSVHGKKSENNSVPIFQCSICLKKMSSALTLRLHGDTHVKDDPQYQCPHCPMKLKQKHNIPRHIKVAHPTEFSEMKRRKRSKVDLSIIDQKIVV